MTELHHHHKYSLWIDPDALNWKLLPKRVQEIASCIGRRTLLILSDVYGGIDLYIPQYIGCKHELYALLGRETTQMISFYYGGDRLAIPSQNIFNKILKYSCVICLWKNGESISKIARVLKVSRKTVRRIIKSLDI